MSKLSILISVLIIILIITVVCIFSFRSFSEVGFGLFSLEWSPSHNEYGILSMLYGTISVTIITMIFAVPIGIFSAVYLAEILNCKYRVIAKSFIEILAGVPSIVYGLIGVTFFTNWIQNFFDLQSGRIILTGGILLSIIVLPTIISLSASAFNDVSKEYREVAKSLGLYDYEIIINYLYPMVKSHLGKVVFFAFGRTIGETMAVMLVIGGLDKVPTPIYNILSSGQTITSKIGREIGGSAYGSLHFSVLISMSLILLVIVLIGMVLMNPSFWKGIEEE